MIYTQLIKKALQLSFIAHKDQVDKTGLPYIYHPLHLAYQLEDEYEIVTALLHDVVEDTSYTFEDLKQLGFPNEVIEALHYLTHDPSVSYENYIKKIKQNKLARKVKQEDLKHNSDLSRLNIITIKDIERNKKYKNALDYLEKDER